MAANFQNLNDQSGVSLVETLVVVVIIAIVATLALMQMGTANTQFQRQNVARELKVAFERARFDSVKRHAGAPGPATVEVGSTYYTLTTGSGSPQMTTLPAGITIAGYTSMALPVTVTFDKRGEVTTTGSVNPQFLVCNVTCSSPSSATANIVLVTPTGTVNLLPGDAPLPAFDSPTVTNPAVYISNTVRVP